MKSLTTDPQDDFAAYQQKYGGAAADPFAEYAAKYLRGEIDFTGVGGGSSSAQAPDFSSVAGGSSVPGSNGLAKRVGLQNVAGLLDFLSPLASGVDFSGQAPGGPTAPSLTDVVTGPGAGTTLLGNAIQQTPEPQGAGQRMAVGALSQVLPSMAGGPAAVLPGMASGAAAGAVQGMPDDNAVSRLLKVAVPLLTGMATGKAQGAIVNKIQGGTGEAAQALDRVAKQEPASGRDLTAPGQAGVETLTQRVEEPLSQALQVTPANYREHLAALDEQVKAINDKYPEIMGTPERPTMVPLSPRLQVALENPRVRSAIEARRNELNDEMTRGVSGAPARPRPPIPALYDNAGNLLPDVAQTGVPLELLDQVKQGFDAIIERNTGAQSIQRRWKNATTTLTGEVLDATKEQLANMGLGDYAEALSQRHAVESQRSAMDWGLGIFKKAEKGSRGKAIPQDDTSIAMRYEGMSPAEQEAARQGMFVAIRDKITAGSLSPKDLARLRSVVKDKAQLDQIITAERRAKTLRNVPQTYGAETAGGTRGQQATIAAAQAAAGMESGSIYHTLRALLTGKPISPQAQVALQQYFATPEGADLLRRATAVQDMTKVGGMAGPAIATANSLPQ